MSKIPNEGFDIGKTRVFVRGGEVMTDPFLVIFLCDRSEVFRHACLESTFGLTYV